MKYIDEFRQRELAVKLAAAVKNTANPDITYRLMEFCGGHTHAIFRYGIQDLMPENVEFVHGPGCPVCVLPAQRLDMALTLLERENIILCCYGDLLRVPASNRKSLLQAKAQGSDVRMVYSTQDALNIARKHPDREVVFFAIGFETTTPPTAIAILQAQQQHLKNFSVFCNHVLTPAALTALLTTQDQVNNSSLKLDGFLGPSHVSSIIGSRPYEFVPKYYYKPVVIAGFEPLDVMQATLMLIQQINQGRCKVENQYTRVVTPSGNIKAQQITARVMQVRDSFEWRGLGFIPQSALQLRDEFAAFDSEQRFAMPSDTAEPNAEHKACACPDILRGLKKPTDCRLFGKVCSPENPMGSCMVSSEGACAAYYSYGRFRSSQNTSKEQVA
ncbi:hydrogenase expression/formation protein HypD [Alteromonadaceae bacterium 2753L.S.0a.02]|nr:hydrogenase expression/formation protein HypD [Alteromonadaceae bacterium 2753L.S.0a.02]